VLVLAENLKAEGMRSKVRVSRTGKEYGNAPFSRGALYLILKNRIYLGEIMHKGKAYPGEHNAIVGPELFARVAALLRQNRNNHVNGVHAEEPSLLIGKVYDGLGRIMSPDHASKRGRRYRYYASRTEGSSKEAKAWRVPAGDLEGLVLSQLSRRFDPETMSTEILSIPNMAMSEQRALIGNKIGRIDIHLDRVDIRFTDGELTSVAAPIIRRGRETRLAIPPDQQAHAQRDPALIKLLIKAHRARQAVETGNDRAIAELAQMQGYSRDYFGVLLRIAYLAPDIIAAILDGRQPVQLNRQRLARATNLPLDWQGQRAMLGFT